VLEDEIKAREFSRNMMNNQQASTENTNVNAVLEKDEARLKQVADEERIAKVLAT
jgi:hypothetical protein